MKEFFTGLVFLIFLGVLAGLAALIFPLLLLIAFILRFLLSAAILVFFIWLLGKLILFLSKK
jgi:membrane protein implicated in regulation of membrane protease activity